LQQGALAGTGMPGDEQHLALVHAKADVDQGLVPTRILLADVLESEDGHGRDYAGPRTSARPPRRASENRRPTTRYPRTWRPRPGIRDATTACARAGARGSAADQRAQLAADAAQQRRRLGLGRRRIAHRRHRLADRRHRRRIGLLTGGRGDSAIDRLALAATATLARRALGVARRGRHGAGSRRLRLRLRKRGLLHRGHRRDGIRHGLGLAGGALARRLAARTTLTLATLAAAPTAAAATPCAAAAAG